MARRSILRRMIDLNVDLNYAALHASTNLPTAETDLPPFAAPKLLTEKESNSEGSWSEETECSPGFPF